VKTTQMGTDSRQVCRDVILMLFSMTHNACHLLLWPLIVNIAC